MQSLLQFQILKSGSGAKETSYRTKENQEAVPCGICFGSGVTKDRETGLN